MLFHMLGVPSRTPAAALRLALGSSGSMRLPRTIRCSLGCMFQGRSLRRPLFAVVRDHRRRARCAPVLPWRRLLGRSMAFRSERRGFIVPVISLLCSAAPRRAHSPMLRAMCSAELVTTIGYEGTPVGPVRSRSAPVMIQICAPAGSSIAAARFGPSISTAPVRSLAGARTPGAALQLVEE